MIRLEVYCSIVIFLSFEKKNSHFRQLHFFAISAGVDHSRRCDQIPQRLAAIS